MGPFFLRFLNQLAKFYTAIIGVIYLGLVTLGMFSYESVIVHGPTPGHIALFGFFIFLLAWRIAVLALAEPADDVTVGKLELGFLCQVGIAIVLQLTGGIDSPIFPIFYLGAALMVYYLGFASSILLAFAILATLTLHAFWHGILLPRWYQFFAALGFTMIFNFTIALFIKIPRARAKKAQDQLSRLTNEAEHLSRERRAGLVVLSRDSTARADVSALLQIDKVLTELAEITKRALQAHTCVIALIGPDQESLVVHAVESNEKPPEKYWRADLGRTILAEILEKGGTLRVDRIKSTRAESHRPWGLEPRSVLASPLIENNRIVGVLAADSQYEGHFAREEERFVMMMARQVVSALSRERLYRDVSAERSEFAAFYDLIKQLGSSIDLDTVSRVILESVQDIVAYDFGALVKVDHENQQGAIEAVAGLPAEQWLDARFSLNESLVGWVIGSKTYLHYPNLRDRQQQADRRRPVFSDELALKDVGSLLCLPLIRQNFVTGLLIFGAKEASAFTHYEIKILEVLAVQAAVSLENARVHAKMEQMAARDGLTECHNHRYFQEWLDHELHRALRMPIPISLVMCDIDNFKKFNDKYGHPLGDQVLKTVARIFRGNVRKNDLAARYGGEEFALVLLNSDHANAVKFADRVRREVEKARIDFAGQPLGVTVSMGIATYPTDARDKAALIDLADKALYAAKQGGRNRVVHAQMLSLQTEK
ncbi:MAG: diguanylate cyclase [Myxococcales bacterium]|nr:diguanylate cyclase [Myxococcales bacterium]